MTQPSGPGMTYGGSSVGGGPTHQSTVGDTDVVATSAVGVQETERLIAEAREDLSVFDGIVDRARAIASTIRRPRDNATLLRVARGVPVVVRVFDEADAEWVRARGGTPVVYSIASADNLMEWYEDQHEELNERLAQRLRARAPSSVADAPAGDD